MLGGGVLFLCASETMIEFNTFFFFHKTSPRLVLFSQVCTPLGSYPAINCLFCSHDSLQVNSSNTSISL